MAGKKKILIIQKINLAGIRLLDQSPNYEYVRKLKIISSKGVGYA
tara:strand:+ start:383 stop:517 length:135 start_codon:yes stop_codon:yes gene_type:complete